jgi:hypothetical protein
MKRLALAAAATAAAIAGVAGAGASSAPQPRLLLSVPTAIRAFAADGARIAWLRNTPPGCAVFSRLIHGGAVSKTPVHDRSYCPFDGTQRWLAVGGTRVLWALATAGHNSNEIVETALFGRRASRLAELSINPGVHGDEVSGVGGDVGALLYAVRSFACTENPDTTINCKPTQDAVSGLWRVNGGRRTRVLPGSMAGIAVAGRRFAAVEDDFVPRAILIGDLRSIQSIKHIDVGSRIDRIAMSGTLVAAETANGLRFFDARTGKSRGGSKIRQISSFAVSGSRVAFVRRKSIFLLERGRVTRIASRGLVPVGLTIENGRLLWAENPRGHGEVYSLPLPR